MTAEERALLGSYERGEWRSVPGVKAAIKEYSSQAAKSLAPTSAKSITIRRPDAVALIEEAARRFAHGNKTEAVALAVRRLLAAERGGRAVGTVGQVGAEGCEIHAVAARPQQETRRGPGRAGALGRSRQWRDRGPAERPARASQAVPARQAGGAATPRQAPRQSKERKGSLFGAHRGSVRIRPGVDLTEPILDDDLDAATGKEIER